MTDAEIRDAIAEIAHRKLKWEGPLPEGDLAAHLDSLARLTLVVEIEDRFSIALDPDAGDEVKTIADVVKLVQEQLRARGAC